MSSPNQWPSRNLWQVAQACYLQVVFTTLHGGTACRMHK